MAATDSHELAHGPNKARIRRKPSKPWQSVLDPFVEFIADLRSGRRPVPYRKIPALIKEKFDIEVAYSTVASFVRARSKERHEKKIHPSHFHKKPISVEETDEGPIEVLRPKRIEAEPPTECWKSLDVEGPLIREPTLASAKGKRNTTQ